MRDLKMEKRYYEEQIRLLNYLQKRYNEISKTECPSHIKAMEKLIDIVIEATE